MKRIERINTVSRYGSCERKSKTFDYDLGSIAFTDYLSLPDKKRAQKVKAKENYKRKPKHEPKLDTRFNMVMVHGKV